MNAADSQAIATWVYVAVTIGLLLVAFFQLRGLARSNQLVAESNQQLAESNRALVRPYVAVDFGFKRYHSRDPRAPIRASLTIEVTNFGRTTAQDIKVISSPQLGASLKATEGDPAASQAHLEELRAIFGGEKLIRSLVPGRTLTYVLDRLPDAMNTEGVPKGYDLAVEYKDIEGQTYKESYRMDFEGWEQSVGWGDDLQRISRDIQALNETGKDVVKKLGSLGK